MANLDVDADYLIELAGHLEEAAISTETARDVIPNVGDGINSFGGQLWLTHGVMSGASNNAFIEAAQARRDAASTIANSIREVRNALLEAAGAYQTVDTDTGENLKKQIHAEGGYAEVNGRIVES